MTGTRGATRRAPRNRRTRALALALATLLLGVAVTLVTTAYVRDNARRDAQAEFEQSARQTARSVEQELNRSFDKLRDIGAFVAAEPDAPAAEFQQYVTDTGILDRFPSLLGVFFVQRVEEADLDAFVTTFGRTHPGFAPYEIGEHPDGAPYYLLTYYVPGKVDLGLPIGTDVTPIASVTELMEHGRTTNTGVAGSFQDDPLLRQIAQATSFPLVDNLLALDFFAGLPVTQATPPSGTSPSSASGWVGATVGDFQQVAAEATRGQPEDIGLSLTVDLSSAGMGDRADLSRVAEQAGGAGPRADAAFETSESFAVEGITWRVDLWSAPNAGDPPLAVTIVLVGGLVASLLAAGFVYLRVRAHDRERAFALAVADSEQFQRDVLDSVTDPMVVLDADGHVVRANPAWSDLRLAAIGPAGAANEARLAYVDLLRPAVPAGMADLDAAIVRALVEGGEVADVDIAVDTAGPRRWFGVRATPLRGPSGGAVVVHTDVTERRRSHDELELKASRDDLTGLLNRAAFEGEVDRALGAAAERGASVGVLFIDLDGFKPINDTHGHAVGDDVLRTVARRLAGAVRTTDRVARLGGDEFVVLVHPLGDPAVASATAERILAAFAAPARVDDLEVPLRASIGVAVVDGRDPDGHDRLIRRADEAMYAAKQDGGGRAALAR